MFCAVLMYFVMPVEGRWFTAFGAVVVSGVTGAGFLPTERLRLQRHGVCCDRELQREYICLSVRLSACLPVYLSVCMSACLFACLSASLSACLPLCLTVCVFFYDSSVCLLACLSVLLPACPSVCLSNRPCACLPVCLPDGYVCLSVPLPACLSPLPFVCLSVH